MKVSTDLFFENQFNYEVGFQTPDFFDQIEYSGDKLPKFL
jgi:hypothetical protein